MAKARRTFTREFKVQAVQLVTEQGKSIAEVARDLVSRVKPRTCQRRRESEGSRPAS